MNEDENAAKRTSKLESPAREKSTDPAPIIGPSGPWPLDCTGTSDGSSLTHGFSGYSYSGPSGSAPRDELTVESVTRSIRQKLEQHSDGVDRVKCDLVFSDHTEYLLDQTRNGDPKNATEIWEKTLKAIVEEWERTHSTSVHKGAPLYNTGVAYFLIGDFEKALQYVFAAGEEDERLSPGSLNRLLDGHHPLSPQILFTPLETDILVPWGRNYETLCGISLSDSELKRMVKNLVDHKSGQKADAIQLLITLHRIRKMRTGPINAGVSLTLTRALGDLLHLVDSILGTRIGRKRKTGTNQLETLEPV